MSPARGRTRESCSRPLVLQESTVESAPVLRAMELLDDVHRHDSSLRKEVLLISILMQVEGPAVPQNKQDLDSTPIGAEWLF